MNVILQVAMSALLATGAGEAEGLIGSADRSVAGRVSEQIQSPSEERLSTSAVQAAQRASEEPGRLATTAGASIGRTAALSERVQGPISQRLAGPSSISDLDQQPAGEQVSRISLGEREPAAARTEQDSHGPLQSQRNAAEIPLTDRAISNGPVSAISGE